MLLYLGPMSFSDIILSVLLMALFFYGIVVFARWVLKVK